LAVPTLERWNDEEWGITFTWFVRWRVSCRLDAGASRGPSHDGA
jgi:hypothetical protein